MLSRCTSLSAAASVPPPFASSKCRLQCRTTTAAAMQQQRERTSARPLKGGYIGSGNQPASQYHSNDFTHAAHLETALPIIQAQLQAARQLQQERAASGAAATTSGQQPSSPTPTADQAANANLSARARRRLRNVGLKQQRRQQQREEQTRERQEVEAAAASALIEQHHQQQQQQQQQQQPQPPAAAASGLAVEMDCGISQGDDNEWEVFFRAHPTAKFFRERRYLGLSFPCLAALAADGDSRLEHIVELGAGCGSSILPLLKIHPQ